MKTEKIVELLVDTINTASDNTKKALDHFSDMVANGALDQDNATEVAAALSTTLLAIADLREKVQGVK